MPLSAAGVPPPPHQSCWLYDAAHAGVLSRAFGACRATSAQLSGRLTLTLTLTLTGVQGNQCPYAHGVYERNLHPSKYRTQLCTEGERCSRRVCFFAHSHQQLRMPVGTWSLEEAVRGPAMH